MKLAIPLDGSLQNPAFSRDGNVLSFTRFIGVGKKIYNRGNSDVWTCGIDGKLALMIAGRAVSQPGACQHPTAGIIFSRTMAGGHDEIWRWRGGMLDTLTSRANHMAYEPSWGKDGLRFAFESHVLDQEGNGRIAIGLLGGNDLIGDDAEFITPDGSDCRQPNWSRDGRWIIYQEKLGGRWVLRLYDVENKRHSPPLQLFGDATDATFSPDSSHFVYSGEYRGMDGCLLAVPVLGGPVVYVAGAEGEYHGAPSWGPNGKIACEWGMGDPDTSGEPTKIVLVEAPR